MKYTRETVKALVDEFEVYLENHVIERRSESVWLCKNPKSSEWWFGVALGPCMVAIWGDVNEIMMRPYEANPFGWVTGMRWDGWDYPLGKAPANMELKEFYPELAESHLNDLAEEVRAELAEAAREAIKEGFDVGIDEDTLVKQKFLDDIRDAWDGETEQSFVQAQVDAGDDEPYDARDWSRGSIISYVCLCWWARKIREDPSYA